MNILLCVDQRALKGAELVIATTMKHNRDVNWYIFTMDLDFKTGDGGIIYRGLTDDDVNWLRKIVRYFDNRSNLCKIDVLQHYLELCDHSVNRETHFTPYACLRLLVDRVLPELHDILYLDCDVTVQNDISPMYYEYLKKGKSYCAYSIPDACDYEGEMVSGVLLFNLDVARRERFFDRVRNNYNKNLYRYPDQMALRDTEDPYPLPETYNYMFPLDRCFYTPDIIHHTAQIDGKIYTLEEAVYYRRFPNDAWVKDLLSMLRTLPFTVKN